MGPGDDKEDGTWLYVDMWLGSGDGCWVDSGGSTCVGIEVGAHLRGAIAIEHSLPSTPTGFVSRPRNDQNTIVRSKPSYV